VTAQKVAAAAAVRFIISAVGSQSLGLMQVRLLHRSSLMRFQQNLQGSRTFFAGDGK
jgi:hypothetical protein